MKGDSGGPLMIPLRSSKENRWAIAGIVSYGPGCGRAGKPGVYARVSSYFHWISNIIHTGDDDTLRFLNRLENALAFTFSSNHDDR